MNVCAIKEHLLRRRKFFISGEPDYFFVVHNVGQFQKLCPENGYLRIGPLILAPLVDCFCLQKKGKKKRYSQMKILRWTSGNIRKSKESNLIGDEDNRRTTCSCHFSKKHGSSRCPSKHVFVSILFCLFSKTKNNF